MRVYEFARKIGATSASVMRMAEEAEVEVYSPLSEIDEGDLEALNQRYLQVGPGAVKADSDAVAARRAEKVARAAAIQAEKDKAQAAALEAARQRAIAAAEGRSVEPPPKAPEKEKPIEIKVNLPELPKVTIQVSEDDSHADEEATMTMRTRTCRARPATSGPPPPSSIRPRSSSKRRPARRRPSSPSHHRHHLQSRRQNRRSPLRRHVRRPPAWAGCVPGSARCLCAFRVRRPL